MFPLPIILATISVWGYWSVGSARRRTENNKTKSNVRISVQKCPRVRSKSNQYHSIPSFYIPTSFLIFKTHGINPNSVFKSYAIIFSRKDRELSVKISVKSHQGGKNGRLKWLMNSNCNFMLIIRFDQVKRNSITPK